MGRTLLGRNNYRKNIQLSCKTQVEDNLFKITTPNIIITHKSTKSTVNMNITEDQMI